MFTKISLVIGITLLVVIAGLSMVGFAEGRL